MGDLGQIPSHQVKVDNWPLFFLQRLYHFYRKKSHCDLTLMFSALHSVKSIKVHKLVLHACTDYFESLDVMKDSEHGEFLQLSNEMHPDVVIPIISFMYTGKLEFPVTLQPRLYEAATKLRMTILTKLLDVQPNPSTSKQTLQSSQEAVSKVVQSEMQLLQTALDNQNETEQSLSAVEITQPSSAFTPLPATKQGEESVITFTPTCALVASQVKPNFKSEVAVIQRAEGTPVKTIVTKAKVTKSNVGVHFTTVSPKPKIVDASLPPTLPGRKLPIWKRKVPFCGSQSGPYVSPELQKPTRFEWDEDLNDPSVLRPVEEAPKILAYDGGVTVNYPIILEGDVDSSRYVPNDSTKRSSDGSCSESPPYKRTRSDLQDMKEYGKQQQLRNEIICSEENSEDMMDTDELYGACDDDADDLEGFNQTSVNPSTPKPILKSVSKPESPIASKRVRFSLEGKENNQHQSEPAADFTAVKQLESPATEQKIILPMNLSQIQSGKHHVKIVSEVLKKYPSLAKRENIKLRVVSKKPAAVPPTMQQVVEGDASSGNKSSSSLVSYIFLTNKNSGDLLSVKGESTEKEKVFDVENRTGPWICHVCDELNPLQFDSYYTYRRHLVEVHELKVDARICEYCGLKNSKRNHLLYHLYMKHGIDPPAYVSFPKCPECDYVALSDALLIKHKLSHDSKSLTCYVCNVMFTSHACMQKHLLSFWHKSKLKEVSPIVAEYPCPFCEDRFESGNELKNHIETCHQSQKASERGGKQIYRCPYCEGIFEDGDKLGKHIVSLHWGKNKQSSNERTETESNEPHFGQQLEYGEAQEVSREGEESSGHPPSSELESLSSVASGIATSLSLVENEQTVVYYDQRTEGQDIGREATVVSGDECRDYIISGSEDMRQQENKEEKLVDIENDDSNSRISNAEDVHPVSCSDHDYIEPHTDDGLRQLIPVQQVENQIPVQETSVIQQILPDQRLVFSTQGNGVFQSPCFSLSPQVLLAPGKMVLPRIATNEQNVILSQVISQTEFILSNPILQPTGEIVEDGSNTIVFASQEAPETVQTVEQYQVKAERDFGGKPPSEMEPYKVKDNQQEKEEETGRQEKENKIEDTDTLEEVLQSNQSISEEAGSVDSVERSTSEAVPEECKAGARVETAKIVDDWDETNDSQQNVERRSDDGPSRPEFF